MGPDPIYSMSRRELLQLIANLANKLLNEDVADYAHAIESRIQIASALLTIAIN